MKPFLALKVSKPWIKNGQVIFDAKSNSIVAKGGGGGGAGGGLFLMIIVVQL